jgi:putative endonuclease
MRKVYIEMYYVYVLKSEQDGKFYTGHTDNIDRRLSEHNSGKVRSTASRKPFILVHSEIFPTRSEARWRERCLKTAWGKKQLKSSLNI